jgi:hypothetical protein
MFRRLVRVVPCCSRHARLCATRNNAETTPATTGGYADTTPTATGAYPAGYAVTTGGYAVTTAASRAPVLAVPPKVDPVDPEKPPKKLRGIRKLISTLGVWLALYYFMFNECCVILVTAMLHNDYLQTGDIESLFEYLGVSKYVDVQSHLQKTLHIGPWEISGRLAANFALASLFMSLWTPIQIPFCVMTLPAFKHLVQIYMGLLWCRPGRK